MTDAMPTPTMTDDAISEEMVEAAAKAVAAAVGLHPTDCAMGNFTVNTDGISSSECLMRVWEMYRCHARAVLEAALPIAVARERGWEPAETIPRAEGSHIRALVETELVMEEFVPAVLMGGWKRCLENDRIIGWKPAIRSGNGESEMKCQTCHGLGYIIRMCDIPGRAAPLMQREPCPDCIGGTAHCCDGLCEQPEPEPDPTASRLPSRRS